MGGSLIEANGKVSSNESKNVGQVIPLTPSIILSELASGMYGNQIAKKYGVTKQAVSYHVVELRKKGLIEDRTRDAYKIIAVTPKGERLMKSRGFSSSSISKLLSEEPIRMHSMQCSMSILREGKVPEDFWDKVNKEFNHWQPKYKYLPSGIRMTLEKTPDKIIIHLHKRGIKGHEDASNLMMRACHYAAMYLKQFEIECDVLSGSITSQHYAVEDDVAKSMTEKGLGVTVSLGRDTTHILPMDKPRKARAWVDASEGRPEIESNDLAYAVRYIKMPELVAQTAENLNNLAGMVTKFTAQDAIYAQNLNAHIPVLVELKPAIQEMRATMQELRDMVRMFTESVKKMGESGENGKKE